MAIKRLAAVDENRCVACGACVLVCPRHALSVWRGCHAAVDETLCVGCGKCAKICPADSIALKERTGA